MVQGHRAQVGLRARHALERSAKAESVAVARDGHPGDGTEDPAEMEGRDADNFADRSEGQWLVEPVCEKGAHRVDGLSVMRARSRADPRFVLPAACRCRDVVHEGESSLLHGE